MSDTAIFLWAVFTFYCWHWAEISDQHSDRIVLYFLVMFLSSVSVSAVCVICVIVSSCPRSPLVSDDRFLSRLCPWLCLDDLWNAKLRPRVKMINSKLIILLLLLGPIVPGQGQMGWGHSAPRAGFHQSADTARTAKPRLRQTSQEKTGTRQKA